MLFSLSVANGSLYEACRLIANRWNNGANSNQLYRPEASRLLTVAPADRLRQKESLRRVRGAAARIVSSSKIASATSGRK
jgi:hypothetical protein